jgi:hypothetical protein
MVRTRIGLLRLSGMWRVARLAYGELTGKTG